MPKFHEQATAEAEHLSHQIYFTLYQFSHAAAFQTEIPSKEKMDWLSEKYPNTFDKYYRPRWEMYAEMEKQGKRYFNAGLPQLCQVCQVPMCFTEISKGKPLDLSYRLSEFKGDKFHTCTDACKAIFDHEPEKYSHAWLPVHQIFQGNCGGAEISDVLKNYHFNPEDSGEYKGSADDIAWRAAKGESNDIEESA